MEYPTSGSSAPGKREQSVKEKRCWICGDKRGKYGAFVIGPMCAINRISCRTAIPQGVRRVRHPVLPVHDAAASEAA